MKRKIFFKSLLVAACLLMGWESTAWADEVQTTLFHWAYDNTSSVTTITNGTALTGVTGGTLTPGTTNDSKAFSAKDKISAYGTVPSDMKAAGTAGSNAYYLKNGSGALSLKVELTSGTFQVGDVVQICGTGNWNVSTVNSKGGKDGDVITKIETGSSSNFVVASGTIPEGFTPSNTLYFARQDGTTCGICAIKITRTTTKTVTSKVLTGIKINGTSWNIGGLSNNAATIADEYAGPPTVQFIYIINYDDSSSDSGKTENVVAAKSGSNYVATSTALTTNVTLTFNNVSNVLFSITDPTAPTEALASKASSAVTATFSPDGSATVYNGHTSNTAVMVYNGAININGSSNSYFKASFPAALAEGDIIDCSNHSGSFYVWYSDSKTNSQTLPYTIPANSDLIGKKTLYLKKNGAYDFTWLTVTRPKSIETQELGGVKEGSTTLTETTDYTVSSTTITLTEAHRALVAPTNIKLINHITYDDSSTEDRDVAVSLVQNGDFFEGTTTIGATTYTVKVPVNNSTPALILSASSGSISLNSYTPTGSVTVTLTGTNLTDGTYDAPTAEGLTISPATYTVTDGAASQEFTITSTASTAASTDIVFEYDGAESQTYTLSYSKTAKRSLSQTDVTTATIWDWTKVGGASIELTASTDPANGAEFLLAALPEINNDANFNSQTLKVACQWPNRGTSYYFQGNTVKFNTTVPGTVQVWFSNTSNRTDTPANRRFLYVNGTNSGVYTLNQTFTNTDAMPVTAGEVIINAFTGEDTPAATMIRINKIVFIPNSTVVNLNTSGYATYSTFYDVTVSGAKAYTATLDYSGGTITCEEIISCEVPAGNGVLLYGEPNAEVTLTPTTGAAALGDNNLKATTLASGLTATKGANNYYVLSGNAFKHFTGDAFAAHKAYFEVEGDVVQARDFNIVFKDNVTTGISRIENEKLRSGNSFFDLQGRRITLPTKGLYIFNGKKVVVK